MPPLRRTPTLWLAAAVIGAAAASLQAQTASDPVRPPGAEAGGRAAEALAAAFKRADANNDGRLTREEAARMPAVADRFEDYDKDGDGTLTLEELSAALLSK